MNANDIILLEESFKKFYFENHDLIHVPENSNQREFGFQKFGTSGMTRHISLKTDKDLHLLLMQKVPSDVYCSNASYSFPNLPMNEKDWKHAELIFDIDAKDLDIDQRGEHSCIKCSQCNQISKLQQSCPNCQSRKLSKITLSCNDCMEATKIQVKMLNDILINTVLAGKDMNVGMYYLETNEYLAALNRFKKVIDSYEANRYTPEALYRIVEIYYILGMFEDSKKIAAVLGYNYPESIWYKKSYKIVGDTNTDNSDDKGWADKILKKIF